MDMPVDILANLIRYQHPTRANGDAFHDKTQRRKSDPLLHLKTTEILRIKEKTLSH